MPSLLPRARVLLARVAVLPPSSEAQLVLAMPVTSRASRSLSPEATSPSSALAPGALFVDPTNHSGVPDRVKIADTKKKKVKRIVEVGAMSAADEKVNGLTDIEDFGFDDAKLTSTLVTNKSKNTHLKQSKVNAPANWEEILAGIRKMMLAEDAPLQAMNCQRVDDHLPPKEKRFAILISSLLSSQTKGEITEGAVARLSEKGLLDVDGILRTDEATIASLIKPVAFYSRKAHYMKEVGEICLGKYGGDIPSSINELLELPGVGPKIGHLVMILAWKNVQGICVDTHVHRICNRLGWVSHPITGQKTSTPEQTRVSLETWLPKDLWDPINPLLLNTVERHHLTTTLNWIMADRIKRTISWLWVEFGRAVCSAPRPRCGICIISHLCPSAFREVTRSPNSKEKRVPI